MTPKNRSAAAKTLFAIEHHAKHLKELVNVVSVMALASGFRAKSSRGGANSWSLYHPDGRLFKFRGYPTHRGIEVFHANKSIAMLTTRSQVVRWFETV